MVAAVSGSGLGLFGSSVSMLGGAGTTGNAALGRGTERVYVNTATGNLIVQNVDEQLKALGLDLAMVRTYNSQGLLDDDNGDNWRLGVQERVYGLTGPLNTSGSKLTKVFGDGREVVYSYDTGRSAYVSTEGDGAHDTLANSSGTWTWTDGSGRNTETYNGSGQLTQSQDADGNRVSYTYTGSLLTQITDASGQNTYLDYTGNNLTKIRVVSNGQTQTLTRYTYDGSNRLVQVTLDLTPLDNATTDNVVYTTTYTYDGTSKRIASITQADGSSVAFTYQQVDGEYRVQAYTDAEGRLTTINYSQASQAGASSTVSANTGILSTTDTVDTNYSLNTSALTGPSGAWSTPAALESASGAASQLQVAADNEGNTVAAWVQGGSLYARRYEVINHTWGTAVVVSGASTSVTAVCLSADWDSGNAMLTWVDAGNQVRANRLVWDGTTYAWAGSELLATASVALSEVTGGINGAGVAAVSWLETNGTTRTICIRRHDGSSWAPTESVSSSTSAITAPKVTVQSDNVVQVVWRGNEGGVERLYTRGYSTAWGSTLQLSVADSNPVSLFRVDTDPWPDVNVAWVQGNTVYVGWGSEGQAWQSALEVATSPSSITDLALSSSNFDASALAWITTDGNVYVNCWAVSGPDLIGSGTGLSELRVDANNNNDVAVSWRAGSDLYVVRRIDGAWTSPALLEAGSGAAASAHVVVNDKYDGNEDGELLAVFRQHDGTADSIFASRYTGVVGGEPYYTVPSGANWQSMANTLYEVNSVAAGTALQSAMGNPALTAGAQLRGLPSMLGVPATQTVPAYYTVQSGNTWTSITQTIYGTSDAVAVAALQAATGNPALTTGLHLSVPLTLSYGSGSGTLYRQADLQDALGFVTTYLKDSSGRLTSVLSPTVNGARLETRYAYDADGNVVSITEDPSGLNRVTTMAYDTNGNLLSTRDSAGNTVTRTYNAHNQLLTQTQYLVRDPDGAGAGQASVPLTTRYVYDAEDHLRFAISAQGRVTEHRYDTAGERTTTLKYTDGLYGAVPFALSDLSAWAGGQIQTRLERTDYTYDFRGNVSALTQYAYTDASGVGVPASGSTTYFVYDQRGLLQQTVDPRGVATSGDATDYRKTYAYDGLGRLLSATEWVSGTASRTTSTSYDDAGNRTVVTFANGLVTTSQYDHAGELISVINSGPGSTALGATTYAYDRDGRLRMVTDPTGLRVHRLHDAAGRKIAEIDADGTLTEFVYGSTSQIVKTIQYGVRLDPTTLVDGSGNPVTPAMASLRSIAGANPSADRIERAVYDNAGRLTYMVAADGALTQYFYDGAAQLTSTMRYATAVSISRTLDELAPTDITVPTASSDDRRTRNFYDNDGRLLAALDAEGGLVENEYDAAGQLVHTLAYATAAAVAQRQNGTLAQLRPAADAANDIHTRFFYDAQGRHVGTLDGESRLNQIRYDLAGNVVEEVRYDANVTYTNAATLDSLLSLIPGGAPRRSTLYRYDGLNQLLQQTNPEGTITRNVYDMAGRIVSSTSAADTTEARTVETRYDALGRVTQELTAAGSAAITGGMTQAQIDAVWAQYSMRHDYDLAGRRIATTDQNGHKTLFYCDADGRVRYTVNALGEVRESRYDALGQLTDQIHYFSSISTTGLTGGLVATNLTSRIVADTRDAHDTFTYTLTGQLATASTAEGGLITHSYNLFEQESARSERIDGGNSLAHSYTYDRRGLMTQAIWNVGGVDQQAAWSYDAFGRAIQTTDQHGLQRTMVYDRLGRTVQVRDPARNLTLAGMTYDAFARVLTSTDALGNATHYAYDDVARSVIVTTPEGIAVTTLHNRHGQTATVTDARGRVVTYQYDANGRLRTTSDTKGTLTDTRYDRAGLLIESRDAKGILTSMTYDAANRMLTRTVDPGGIALVTTYAYANSGRTLTVTDQRGVVTKTEYDRDGRVATVTVDPTGLNIRTVYAYDARGKVLTVTEGEGSANPRVTRYAYDKLGRRTSETVDPGAGHLNLLTQYVYDARDNLVAKIDAANNLTRYAYDSENRLVYTVDPLGGVTENVYDVANRITITRRHAQAVNLAGASQTLTLAQVSALIVATPQSDRVRQSVYDRDGREVFVIDGANGVTRKDYDGNGNVTRTTVYKTALPAGTYTTVSSVEAVLLADTGDRVANTVYDARNLARYTVDALGGVIQNSYDANGNLTAQTAFAAPHTLGQSDVAALDSWAQAHSNSTADRTRRNWYDAANRQVFVLDAEGYLTETRYADATRQRTQIVYAAKPTIAAGATLAQVETAATAIADAGHDQSTRTDYDAAGRARRTTDATGAFEVYDYDAVGNRTSLTNKKGDTWTYQYDANHRLTDEYTPQETTISVTGGDTGALNWNVRTNQSIRTHIDYDALGNVKRRIEAMGLQEERTTVYDYDALGRQTRTIFPSLNVYSASSDDEARTGTAVVRVETGVTPDAVVTYDTLGNAVVNRDMAGNYTHKIYDKLGRLLHEVDAGNYLTEHRYDAFGNETQLVRYDAPLTAGLTASAIWTEADVLAHRTVSATKDRTLTTQYDCLNRATTITQAVVFNFEPNQGVGGGAPFSAAPTTTNEYNAFGQLIRQSKLLDPVSGRASPVTYYYDRRGYKTAEVSPLGYVTTYQYDETGDLTRQVEYVTPLAAGSWDSASYPAPIATTRNNAPGNAAGYDRETAFAYDRLNRRVSETRLKIEYNSVSGQTVTPGVGDQETTFGYDALGNQTQRVEANGATTYTYYDKLGRVIAIAEPTRDVNGSDTVTALLTPLVQMERDAYGNVVRETRRAGGATMANAQSFTAAVSGSADRITQTLFDRYGHALRTIDASGANRYASYTVRGDLAKEWQPVTAADATAETLVTIHEYDALGRETRVIEPQRLGGASQLTVHRTAQYSAFGEIIAKGSESGQEYFEYDQAGRLWRTNSGDGVDKVYLFNLKDEATAEIRSQTVDLRAQQFANAAAVHGYNPNVLMRTETRYDLEGHVVERRLPVFTSTAAAEPITTPLLIGRVTAPGNPVYDGVVYYQRVSDYGQPPGPDPVGYRFVINPTATLSMDGGWHRPENGGNFVQDPNFTLTNRVRITWDAPSAVGDPSIVAKFAYRPLGSTGTMVSLPVKVVSSTRIGVDVESLAGQTLEYRLTYQRRTDLAPYAEASGAFHVDGSANSTITVNPAPAESSGNVAALVTTHNDGFMSWAAPADATVRALLKLKLTGSNVWFDVTPARSAGNFVADVRQALAEAGTYDYEIHYLRGDELIARKVGELSSNGYREYLGVSGVKSDVAFATGVSAVASVTASWGAAVGAKIDSTTRLEGRFVGGVPGGDVEFRWMGTNSVTFDWGGSLGSNRVQVMVDYLTEAQNAMGDSSPSQAGTTRVQIFAVGSTGGAVRWADNTNWQPTPQPGGVSRVTRVRVYTETAAGGWTLRYDQANPPTEPRRSMSWTAPSDPAVVASFEIAPRGSGAYTPRQIDHSVGMMSVSLDGLGDAEYDYRIIYRVGNRKTAEHIGVLTLTGAPTAATVACDSAPPAPEAVAAIGTAAAAPAATSTFVSSEGIQTVWNGVPGGEDPDFRWRASPQNSVNLSWSNIGTMPVEVVLDYVSASNPHGPSRVALSKRLAFPTSNSTGVTFTWNSPNAGQTYPSGQLPAGGFSSVVRARVYGRDVSGNYTILLRDTAGPVGGNALVWNAPATPGIAPVFRYRPTSGGSWLSRTIDASSAQWKVDLTGLPGGGQQYDYYIGYQRSGESYDSSSASGKFTIGAATVTRDSQTNATTAPAWIGNVVATNSRVAWSQAASGATVTFEYFINGAWTPRAWSSSNGTDYTVNMHGVGAGSYAYRILYNNGGPAPLYKATGTVGVAIGQPAATVSAQSSATFSMAVISPVAISGDRISWAFAREPNSQVRVIYSVDGGTSYDELAEGSGSNFSKSFSRVPQVERATPYRVRYEILYLRTGETDPYAKAKGIVDITITDVQAEPTVTIGSQAAAYPSGAQPIALPTVSGNFLRWTTPAAGTDTVLFTYNGNPLDARPYGTGFEVDISSIAGGVYNFEITYTRAGAADPYARARGLLGIDRTVTVTGFGLTPTIAPPPVTIAPRLTQTVDRWGNVLSVTDAASHTTGYRYNQLGQLIETKLPQVSITDTTDGLANIRRDTPVNHNIFDLQGRLIATRDANGHVNAVQYNAAGQALREMHADGGAKKFSYDVFGDQTLMLDELDYTTAKTYDKLGRLKTVTREVEDLLSITERYDYDEAGRRIREVNAENETTAYFYDLTGNVIRRRSALNFDTQYQYDSEGRKTLEIDAIGGTQTWAFDYFGRMKTHTDLGGQRFSYDYDEAGARTWQRRTDAQNNQLAGQDIRYQYDEAGQLIKIDDRGVQRETSYRYDAAGRRTVEKTRIKGLMHQNTGIDYDELGRISRLADLRYGLTYSYDAAGNRTATLADYYDHQSLPRSQELWYVYDAMNRVTISQGRAGARIDIAPTQGTRLEYSLKGERIGATTYGDRLVFENIQTRTNSGGQPGDPDMFQDHAHYYTEKGLVTETYRYDGLSRLTATEQAVKTRIKLGNGPLEVNENGRTQLMSSREYDDASRQETETTTSLSAEQLVTRNRINTLDGEGRITAQRTKIGTLTESFVTFGIDAAGVQRSYFVTAYDLATGNARYTSAYTNTVHRGESYQEGGQSVHTTGAEASQHPDGSTSRVYNVNGELESFRDANTAGNDRFFANNQSGQALTVVQGDVGGAEAEAFAQALMRVGNEARAQHFFFANGQAVGSFGQLTDENHAFEANFDVNYTPVSSRYPGAVPGGVVAQTGETLRTVAGRVWGDAGLWYLLAEENGLTDPDAVLESGKQLKVPNRVVSLANTSSSFKPFDVSQAIGDTTPTQPPPPQRKGGGCGVVGQILVIVVAIVATIYTAGLAAQGFAAAQGVALGGAASSSAFAAGTAALSGGLATAGGAALSGTAIAAAAVGGAAGSAISQGVAIAAGIQDGFDWRGVALGAVGAGATAGLGASSAFTKVTGTLSRGNEYAAAAIRATAANALTQGIAVTTGLQSAFNWREVAISAAAAPIAQYAGEQAQSMSGLRFAGQMASGAAGSLVRGAFGGKIDSTTVLADVFGNALGNSLVSAMQAHGVTVAQKRMRDELQRDNPSLVRTYDAFIEQGGDAQTFRALVQNDTAQSALTKLASLEADASKLIEGGISSDQVWAHTVGDTSGSYQIDVDGNVIAVKEGETFGVRTLNALADLQTGLGELEQTVPLDKMLLAVQVATLGPAGFALDYVKGMAVDTFAGKYIKAGVERFATALNAGAHDTDMGTTAYLLNNRAMFEDFQNAAFNGSDFDPQALSNAENLLSLNQDFGRTQRGATMMAAAILMGTAALKGRRTEPTTTPDVRTGAGYGVSDPPVRIQVEWTESDLKQALLGHSPRGLGSPDVHHANQMPGSGIHEVLPDEHRNNTVLHPNKFNQGVTPEMRDSDRRLHWWYRAREQGADQILPDWIYD